VPVSAARALGADLVIAVDLNHDIVARKNLSPLPALEGSRLPLWARSLRQRFDELTARLRKPDAPGSAQVAQWAAKAEPLPNIFEVLLASINIMESRITASRLALDPPDVLIRPPLGHIRFLDFDRAEEIIEIGYRSAVERIAESPVLAAWKTST
jgi:NTE family protein